MPGCVLQWSSRRSKSKEEGAGEFVSRAGGRAIDAREDEGLARECHNSFDEFKGEVGKKERLRKGEVRRERVLEDYGNAPFSGSTGGGEQMVAHGIMLSMMGSSPAVRSYVLVIMTISRSLSVMKSEITLAFPSLQMDCALKRHSFRLGEGDDEGGGTERRKG